MENRRIKISSLKESIEENGLEIITVFGVGPEVGFCDGINHGETPSDYYLGLDGSAELLTIREASPIWENLLDGIEQGRPIYKITDSEDGSWMEVVTYEK